MHFHVLLMGSNEVSVESGAMEAVGVNFYIGLCLVFLELCPGGGTVGLLLN
jgi:hypothetical protein